MDVTLELRNRYEEMSKTNQRIADFVLENTEIFLKLTAIEIAKHCQTSSASIIRFVQMLDFAGLDDFKIALAITFDANQKTRSIDPIISKEDTIDILFNKVNTLVTNSTADCFYQIDKEDFQKSIKIIQNSEKIYLLGIGASSLPAYDLYHKFNRVNIPAVFNFDAHMTVEFFNYLTPKDTVIAFSYSGRTTEVIYPCKIAKEKGANVLSVTRKKASPLSALSDISLTVPNNEHLERVGAIASKVSTMIMADLLYLGVIQDNLDTMEEDLYNTSQLTKVLKMKDNEVNKW